MSKLAFSTIFLILRLTLPSQASPDAVNKVVLLGTEVELSCPSSYPPAWNKVGPSVGDFHIIGANGKRHPNWNEPRYSFTNQASTYFLRISDVHLKDAGRFVCGSDDPKTFVITVMGYVDNDGEEK